MINIIWFAMLVSGVLAAAVQGDIQLVTRATIGLKRAKLPLASLPFGLD